MKIGLSPGFQKKLKKRIEGYEFEIGILKDKAHLDASAELSTFAGGPVLKSLRTKSKKTVGDILVDNMDRLNINLLHRPFQETNSDILKFTNEFLKYVSTMGKGSSVRRVENLLQAIVRNPILREEYGTNSNPTADLKGFNRHLFATGQMFKGIVAKVIKKHV